MKHTVAVFILAVLTVANAQTPQGPEKRAEDQDIIRITTQLVQTDAVVTDKNEQIISDLKLEDFEVFDNGKKQEMQFLEFISLNAPPRGEGSGGSVRIAPGIDTSVPKDLAAKDVRRVLAFVVDDVTIPREDMARVRQMLADFVDNKMVEGDLVVIARTFGSAGMLEQFTTDPQILRRAISQIGPRSIPPYLAYTGPGGPGVSVPQAGANTTTVTGAPSTGATDTVEIRTEFEGPSEGTNQMPRAVLAVSVSNQLVDSMRQLPGRKSLVLLSGGLPLNDISQNGEIIGDLTQLFRLLTDNATRSGVVINTIDVRGLVTRGAVAKFEDTPGKSALGMTAVTRGGTMNVGGGDADGTTGRGANMSLLGDNNGTGQLGLSALAGATGGVAVMNRNDMNAGLERVLNRSKGYYRLAYKPSENFDNKFHKVEIKVRRSGVRVYAAEGYYAREYKQAALTKEEQIIRAAISPLAKRDLDVSSELQYKFSPSNQAQLDINTVISGRKLNLTKKPDGKYHTTFDVVGFVFDQVGKSRGGISQTINAELTEEGYREALATGISYTASTELSPGYYQVRLVVREAETGNIGTVSRYFEVPDLSRKQLTMSSVLLYSVDRPGAGTKPPEQLPVTHIISRKQDLRYAVIVYNGKLDNNKPQLRSRLIISQGDRMLFQEPEQPIDKQAGAPGQYVRYGDIVLAKVPPGRYVLTLVVTDPLAEKRRQTIARSVEFTVVD